MSTNFVEFIWMDFLVDLKLTMAMYSPPTTPQLNPDICGDLLHRLDQEIQATQVRHDEARRRLQREQCEWRCATTHEPLEPDQGQFENVGNMHTQNPKVQFQHDYSFNLTGIVPPQHQTGNKSTICMGISRNLRDPVPVFLMDLWLMHQTK